YRSRRALRLLQLSPRLAIGGGHYEFEHDELIARRAARPPALLEPKLAVRLRALGDLEIHSTGERRHADRLAERRFPRCHGQVEPNVAAVDPEELVRQQPELQEQVAGRPAARARLALPRHADLLTVGDRVREPPLWA